MHKIVKRFFPLGIILLGLALFYFLGLNKYISLKMIKTHHLLLKEYVDLHPFFSSLFFIFSYITIVAFSIPVGSALSILGGYLFPQPFSTFYVVFSATIGATLIFLIAQTALGDFIRKKAGSFLKKTEKEFQDNGAFHLLFLRFIHIFPFWLINLSAAFFGVPLRTFIWTTFVGIIPATLLFTLVGAGLKKTIDGKDPVSISDIITPEIKVALILLGVVVLIPLTIKKMKRKINL